VDGEYKRLSAAVTSSLDLEGGTAELPRLAYKSRTQFYRIFRALIDETPGEMRRRLLLERAAWRLSRTADRITEIAFDSDYGSLEAFTRAFRKAFGVSPSIFRRMGETYHCLPSPNRIHFGAPAEFMKGTPVMDLFDLFAGHETWHTKQLLEAARGLSEEELDRPLKNPVHVVPWDTPDQTLRQILDRIVLTKEVWTAALTGSAMPDVRPEASARATPATMIERLEKTDAGFQKVFSSVRDRGAWTDTFVDKLCEPPETFTFGGMFAHVITFNSYRRLIALDALRRLGAKISGSGCPMDFERVAAEVKVT
jgi:AraC family transcriptional regulator